MSAFLAVLAAQGGPRVKINDTAINDVQFAPTNSRAGYILTNTGLAQSDRTGGVVTLENWVTPTSAAGSRYEVQAQLISGTLDAGSAATGSWLSLGTTRNWFMTQSGVGIKDASLTVSIRLAASGTVLTSMNLTLQARVN